MDHPSKVSINPIIQFKTRLIVTHAPQIRDNTIRRKAEENPGFVNFVVVWTLIATANTSSFV
jgi:hypothetical protein